MRAAGKMLARASCYRLLAAQGPEHEDCTMDPNPPLLVRWVEWAGILKPTT